MRPMLAHRLLVGETLDDSERRDLVRNARRLRAAAREGHFHRSLSGRHVAVAVEQSVAASARVFEDAAIVLGAHVSHLEEVSLRAIGANSELGQLFGRLYDAVDCGGLDRRAAIELEKTSGIPVFSRLGDAGHPLRQMLAEMVDGGSHDGSSELEDMLCLVEAVLVETVA